MEIHTTEFDWEYHYCEYIDSSNYGEYTRHNITVWNYIVIDGKKYQAIYQTGGDFIGNDYNCPDPDLSLDEQAGTDDLLVIVNGLDDEVFTNAKYEEYLNDSLAECKEHCDSIKTVDDLRKLYSVLKNNLPDIKDFVDEDEA